MTSDATAEQLRKELEDIDGEIAELRRLSGDAESRRGQDSDTSEGYREPEELATELTGIAENEAILDTLQQRRERVEAQLKALS
ncbi:hypothetical protein [Actinoplanes solisilvae]|uniref:hypothetical protein n=1 Tax=Actinoplanes solisilvae TaxID=2486853 RepID=UPI000FD8663C|nr:hypothetical protein [Actinoplanes solisilvae]